MLAVPAGASTLSAGPTWPTYTNPVSNDFADTFADPSLLRGKDGWWYSYGTSDPLREGEGMPHRVPIARSHDLVTWSHVGDAFTGPTLPSWAAANASIWAPDVRFVEGQYRMYYVVTETTVTTEPNDNAIGMATAPSPAGPWTDSGGPVVGPRRGGEVGDGNFKWTFDPSVVTDFDGSQWLFYGSYYGGIHVTRLSADGRHATGSPTMVAIDNKFEGAYPVHRDGYWYLFASTANCCAGPTTGYSVQVGRSPTLKGPYVDREGVPLTASRAGGTPVLMQNGNRWVGAGHNAVVTDLGGQDWMAYHAIDRDDPFLDGTDGINERPMLLDRLDWVDGWPAVRAGAGPSEAPASAPLADRRYAADFTAGIPAAFRAGAAWTLDSDPQSGKFARSIGAGTLTVPSPAGESRVEADLKSGGAPYGLTIRTGQGDSTDAVIDTAAATLRLSQTRNGRVIRSAKAPLPAGFDPGQWHSASLQIVAGIARVQLSHARLGDPFVDLTVTLRGQTSSGSSGGTLAGASGVGVDNLSIVKATTPVARLTKDRVPDVLDRARSDEFDGSTLAGGWTWVRKDGAASLAEGALRWPTQDADLTGSTNSAGVLLRDPGSGDWTVETKLGIDLGIDSVRNYQQGGLVAYVNDDLFTRLSHVAIFNTRQTEFGKEMPYAGRLAYGGTIVGPPAATTWLRITHQLDPLNGEHELRAWTSRDGTRWVKGGVWTLPAGADVRVGLISHGGAGATSAFDYLRVYRDAVP
jgi:arabinan endo-1,5-alpha-L-arabinosidase